MQTYLTDTNILIYYFNGDLPIPVKKKVEAVFEESFQISIITKIEFLGWKKHTTETFQTAKRFLRLAKILPLTHRIADGAIHLRRTTHIKTPDALMAVTAMDHQAILVTRNTQDFKQIPQLHIFDPFDAP
jgi:hypothetical protein